MAMTSEKREYDKAYREANREKTAARLKAWRTANRERVAAYQSAWYQANREKMAAQQKVYRHANREKVTARDNAYRKANPEKVRAHRKTWEEANPEKMAAKVKAWAEANPEKRAAGGAARRARKRGTEVKDCPRVEAIYAAASRLRSKGDDVHVDHTIPHSRGGTHTHDNLQILPAEENLSKGAKLPTYPPPRAPALSRSSRARSQGMYHILSTW